MPQSLANVTLHFVFSTKNREQYIQEAWEDRLYEYIGGIIRTQKSSLLAVGGTSDHLHLLISLGREITLAEMMRVVKANSSKWIHETFPDCPFAWQGGYGVFAVGYSSIGAIQAYISRQKQHHAVHTYQDEYRLMLRANGFEWDERYVWD
jgi:putative transposase